MKVPKIRQRAVQQRAEETKEAILQAGIELFSTQGFEGISIRALEEASNTKRGLVAYHFESKEELWKNVVDRVFDKLPGASPEMIAALRGLDKESQIRAHLTSFIQYSAKYPELSRIIIQEGKTRSWRLGYLVEKYVRPRVSFFSDILGGELDAHMLYMFIGAATMVFDVEAECESLYGFNPRSEEFVLEHAKRVCDLFVPNLPLRTDSAD
ncbi:MAG: TetR/AcrR family transcriptional regulator [Pseudomonadota bacterium]